MSVMPPRSSPRSSTASVTRAKRSRSRLVRERELGELKRLAANQVVLELGSALGASATAMAGVARQVHCVDHFRGDPHQGEGDYVHEFFYQMRNVPNVVVH